VAAIGLETPRTVSRPAAESELLGILLLIAFLELDCIGKLYWGQIERNLESAAARSTIVGLHRYPQLNRIIRSMNQILLGAEVPFGCLDRSVAKSNSWICSSSPPAARHNLAHVRRIGHGA
jgi:hypothetical protein